MENKPVNYTDYLKIDELLSLQTPLSDKAGRHSHDEMLFIITHQTYELWFKQILYEIDSIIKIFNQEKVNERDMGAVVGGLNRVVEIQRVLIDQIHILETMTPLDFLDFRDLIFPASGFQSYQFRVLENKLGLEASKRLSYNASAYHAHFTEDKSQTLQKLEKSPSLFDCVNAWLERTPFLQLEDFNFWELYKNAVQTMLENEKEVISRNHILSESDKERNYEVVKQSESLFDALFDEEKYEELRSQGLWRLSYKAVHAALLIQLYRDQPIFQLPFRLLTAILDIDEMMTNWRYRHSLLARRMLGTKIGTGGSSGSEYLKASADHHKIFTDFFQLTTFFIPRSQLPVLPESILTKMGFHIEGI